MRCPTCGSGSVDGVDPPVPAAGVVQELMDKIEMRLGHDHLPTGCCVDANSGRPRWDAALSKVRALRRLRWFVTAWSVTRREFRDARKIAETSPTYSGVADALFFHLMGREEEMIKALEACVELDREDSMASPGSSKAGGR